VKKRVVVVGAGIVGLCVALACAERDWTVTVLERNDADRDGSSFGNTGMIVPSHFVPLAAPGMLAQCLKWMCDPASPLYIRPRASWDLLEWGVRFARACNAGHVQRAAPLLRDLHLASRALYEQLATTDDGFGLTESGVLMLCKSTHALDEESRIAAQARALGMAAETLDAAAIAELEPGIRMDVAGAVHFPLDCNLVPERLVAGIEARLASLEVQVRWRTEVVGWTVDRDTRIRAAVCRSGEQIDADEFVLAAGAWSSALARDLDIRIPMQAGKGYSLTLPHPRKRPALCAILTEARVAVSPMGDALRFGGTMEIAGLDESISSRRVRSLIESIPRYYPEFETTDFDGIAPWRGLRPCSPDGLPYLGRSARCANLVVATGHAMMGVSLAPITGKIAAAVLAEASPGFDLTLLSPDRFH